MAWSQQVREASSTPGMNTLAAEIAEGTIRSRGIERHWWQLPLVSYVWIKLVDL